jgi:hypothetical protein
MDVLLGQESEGLRSALLVIAAGGGLWYVLRVAAALLLVAASRWRPAARSVALRCAPGLLRPLIGRAILGGLLAAGLPGSPAWAGEACGPAAAPILDRGDRCAPEAGATPAPGPGTPPPAAATGRGESDRSAETSITVSAGDSLWSISEHVLGASATPEAVAEAWPKLWRANMDRIGPDPGLIHPGQTLVVPTDLTRVVLP